MHLKKDMITILDNRFSDDIHWKGGCVLGNGMLSWAATMFAWNAKPPNPRYFSESWSNEWRKRLEGASKSWDSIWLSNGEYNDYWKNGSICEDYSQVDIPGTRVKLTCLGTLGGLDLNIFPLFFFLLACETTVNRGRRQLIDWRRPQVNPQ